MYLVQTIKKTYSSNLECRIKYYAILNVLSSLKLAPQDLQVMAYASARGNIFPVGAKKEICEVFGMSPDSLSNIIYKLAKRGILIKDKKSISLTPQLHVDFSSLVLNIHLNEK